MKKIYVCGPTVYSDIHIGNLRPIISIDFVLKAYKYLNIEYKFIHNITDIDDKIIERAIKENKSETEISSLYCSKYLELLKVLNINTISHIEKITQNIEFLIEFIQKLIQKNAAYITKGGVIYDVSKNQNYGMLSNWKLTNTFNSSFDENKKNEQDFYLWKFTTSGLKFNSPWGEGRPGWHTECVAIINKHFKDEGLDLHSGGIDLIFPHHENENAQFYSLYQKELSKSWKYVGTIKSNGTKMSKSLGNIILAKEFIKLYGVDVLRMLILNHRFNSGIDINLQIISNIEKILIKYRKNYLKSMIASSSKMHKNIIESIMKSISQFDYHNAVFQIESLIKNINKNIDLEINLGTLKRVFELLEFDFVNQFTSKNILKKYHDWKEYLENKDYHKADKVRFQLLEEGWI